MNKITTHGIRMYVFTSLLLFVFSANVFSQETYTTIRKNVNPLAFDLNHDLSSTQDSLLLSNKFLFKRVRFIGDQGEKVFNFKPAVKEAKIPLNELPLGNYTVMFYQADKIIVFQIDRLLPFDAIDGLEGDVALNDVDINSEEVSGVDFDFDNSEVVLAANNIEENLNDRVQNFTKAYNLTDLDRSNMQTRAEYRRLNSRPNGKPYGD